jgi:hypothetical protein
MFNASSCSPVHDALHKRLKLCAYKLQLVQKITHKDRYSRKKFAIEMFSHTEEDDTYFDRLCFSEEATFYVHGTVNGHNRHVWESENPHDVTEHECDSTKIEVWCALMKNKVTSLLLSEEPAVTGDTFLAIIENTALHHVPVRTVFQSDGAPHYFSCCVRVFLDKEFPDCWIG